jgi:hypothetical protein
MRKKYFYIAGSGIVLGVLLVPLLFGKRNAVPGTVKFTASVNNALPQSLNYKTVTFGFNIGFLGDLNKQGSSFLNGPLQTVKADGITNVRVYEPFTNGLIKNPTYGPSNLAWLASQGLHVLLSISNYPTVPSIEYDKSVPSKDPSNESFTNRYPPVDVEGQYIPWLQSWLDNLKSMGVLSSMDFEIGNEPDAPQFFWGTAEKFTEIAHATKTLIQTYNRPVYCCGFTSGFANNQADRDPGYSALLADDSFFDGTTRLSFHSYQYDLKDQAFSSIALPHLAGSIITEFNLWAYQKTGSSDRIATMNSPAFAGWLVTFLDYAYAHDIQKVYIFDLADDPNSNGRLGMFDTSGAPKAAYGYFKQIYNVVKDGYATDDSGSRVHLIGKSNGVWYAKGGTITIPATEKIIAASDPSIVSVAAEPTMLASDQWAITQTMAPPSDDGDDTSNSGGSSNSGTSGGSGGGPTVIGGYVNGDTSGYTVSGTPETITQETSQPLTEPVSATIDFTVVQKTPTSAQPSKPVSGTKPAPSPSNSLAAASTITSIDYTLDEKNAHTTDAFPDTWTLDTTELSNDWHTLTATYHYQNGATRQSISIFEVRNGVPIVTKLKGVAQGVWEALIAFFKTLF